MAFRNTISRLGFADLPAVPLPARAADGDFRSRPELDRMTGISWPSWPPEHPVVVIHGTFSGLAEIAEPRT